MGENRRQPSRASGSRARRGAPPIHGHRTRPPRFACSPAKTGIPALASPVGPRSQTRGASTQTRSFLSRPPAPSASGLLGPRRCSHPHGREAGRLPGGAGQGRSDGGTSGEPRSLPASGRSLQPRPRRAGRPPSPSAPGPAGGWASGHQEPRWGWGTLRGRRAHPRHLCGARAARAALRPGRWGRVPPSTRSPKKQFLGDSLTERSCGLSP